MKLLAIVFIILTVSLKSDACIHSEDTTKQAKILSKITALISKNCRLSDSVSKRLYSFLKDNIALYMRCKKDSTDILACRTIIKRMEIYMQEKFGKDVYNAYSKIAYTTQPVTRRWQPKNDSTGRKRL